MNLFRYTISLLGLCFFLLPPSFSQRSKDGAKVIATANNIVNEYTSLTANAAAGATTITVANSNLNANLRFTSNLAPGDLIMIIQLQGAFISARDSNQWDPFPWPRDSSWGMIKAYNNCGNWEFGEVTSVPNATSITFDCPIKNNYTVSGKVVVVRVPRYSSLTINAGGSLTCDTWNGTLGGICAVEVENNTIINAGGSIDITGKGFRGAALLENLTTSGANEASSKNASYGAEKGEGVAGYQADYDIYGGRYCKGAGTNGGGGGNGHNCGGGGGANAGDTSLWNGHGMPDNTPAGWTAAWNLQYAGFAAQTSSGGGQGGYSFSGNGNNRNATTTGPGNPLWAGDNRRPWGGFGGRPLDYSTGRLFLGGGGGSGDQNDNQGGAGGNGGALLYLMNYGTVSGAGQIISNGNNGVNATGPVVGNNAYTGDDGAGGAGAGGTLIVNSVGTVSGISLTANGGNGGNQILVEGSFYLANGGDVYEAEGPGGGGGGGYITVSVGAPTQTVNGGTYGTTNSVGLSEFNCNGATRGAAGATGNVTNFIINAPNVTICSGQSATLTATLSGTVPGGTTIIWYDAIVAGNVLGNGSPYITPVLAAGTYTYYVATCPGTYHQPVIVTVTNSGIISAGADVTICSSASTTLNASGGTSYVWSPATGLSNPNISNPVATPASTTTYVCTATTACGNATDTVIVNITSSAVASIAGNTTICAGGSTTLTASGGGNYSWSTSATTASITVSPTASATYSVFVGSGSCADTASVTVTVSSGITATISGNTTICPGSPTTLTASGGSTYSWSTTAITAAITVSPTTSTTYSVIATSGTCSDTTSITVTITNNITATVTGATTICSGGSAILSASGGNTYSWNTSATTSSITVSPTATTTYSVIASMGTCADTVSATITVASGITAVISGNTAVCGGNSATLTASGGSTYSWSNGSTNTTIIVTPTASSTYSVIASSGSCADTTSVTVNVSPAMNVSMSTVAIQCGTSTGSATANVSGGTPGYTYLWTPTGQTTQQATGLTAGGNYTVTITDAAGCVQTNTVNVVALNAPFTQISGNTLLCTGDATTLTASGGNTYSWSNGSTATSININPPSSITYTVIGYVGNCSDTDTVTVNVLPPPVASVASNTTICNGTPTTLTASGGGNYSWTTGQTSTSITVSPSTTTTYSVYVTIGSCADTSSATVNVVPVPTPTITAANLTICGGDATTLTASGGNTYVWSPGGQTSASIAVTPPSTTTYTVTSGNGVCADTASVTVNVLPPPSVTINGNQNICVGSAAALTATGGTSYTWSSGETTATINPSTAGSYTVIATTGSCTDTAVANVVVNPLPTATALSDITIIQGQSTGLSATGGTSYVWDNSMTGANITVSPQVTTVFCVTATDNNGCADSACVTVTVEQCTGSPFLPNAFSPNADGDNDSLQIYYNIPECVESLKLTVFNRWGEKVYETTDPAFRWSGIYNSGMLQNTLKGGHEVYAYYLYVKFVDGQEFEQKGNVSLLR